MVIQTTGSAELLMKTHGHLTLESYIHGTDKTNAVYPAYRSEAMAYVDFFKWKRLIINGLIGNTTTISHSDSMVWEMDHIIYTLSPGFRVEFKQWLIKGTLKHQCIHRIDQSELLIPGLGHGSTWWNSYQIGIGTKGSYYLYLRNQFKVRNTLLRTWDGQINIGSYIVPKNTLLTGQNHTYRYEIFSLIRYNIGAYNNWASFIGLRQHSWVNADHSTEHKTSLTINLFRKGLINFAGLFYTYYLYDSFTHDKENHLGVIGVKVVF